MASTQRDFTVSEMSHMYDRFGTGGKIICPVCSGIVYGDEEIMQDEELEAKGKFAFAFACVRCGSEGHLNGLRI